MTLTIEQDVKHQLCIIHNQYYLLAKLPLKLINKVIKLILYIYTSNIRFVIINTVTFPTPE